MRLVSTAKGSRITRMVIPNNREAIPLEERHPMTTAPETPKPKWYYNVWFVLMMLFFVLGPFGLPLVWKNPRFSRATKGILTGVMVLYTVLLVAVTLRMFRAITNEINQFNSTFQF